MCGLVGVVAVRGTTLSVDEGALVRMRDTLRHRGPDDAGLWIADNAALAHRRLAVIDPSPAGRQPMASPDGRFVLVYNGELYNDAEVRAELERIAGVRFRTACDTETVLHALAAWGVDAADRLRGMYALALFDRAEQTLTLARDPLGIKPLYLHESEREVLFASEIPALLAHPGIAARPDLVGVSAYLTTIRVVNGTRTLFEGVRSLKPGEWVRVELGGDRVRTTSLDAWDRPARPVPGDVRDAVEDSVRRHLRADVPTCTLLSGGLDSTVITALARREVPALSTYCAGAPEGADDPPGDMTHARRAAEAIGTRHTEAPVGAGLFRERWAEMVRRTGVPLSTPNEVAINEVARVLRRDGMVVTLSGEGADELFGGYEVPLRRALEHTDFPESDDGPYELRANAWVTAEAKATLLREAVWEGVERDAWLVGFYGEEFERVRRQGESAGDDTPAERRLQAHLRFQRRVNLAGLLLRLDSATMLESVEGRTPFSDSALAGLAERLPMREKFAVVAGGEAETKIALRRGFAGEVPGHVLARPKASFPLPFQRWVADSAGELARSSFSRELFRTEAIDAVRGAPERLWHVAWPAINIAMWAKRWWG